jgi:hypothetical protein
MQVQQVRRFGELSRLVVYAMFGWVVDGYLWSSMNDEILRGGGGDDLCRRPDEVLACTMVFVASAWKRLAGLRACNALGKLWQVAHDREVARRAGGRT